MSDALMTELRLTRGLLLLCNLTANAQLSMVLRLVERAAGEPGFADAFENMSLDVIREMKNSYPREARVEDESEIFRAAITKVEEVFAELARQIRQIEIG